MQSAKRLLGVDPGKKPGAKQNNNLWSGLFDSAADSARKRSADGAGKKGSYRHRKSKKTIAKFPRHLQGVRLPTIWFLASRGLNLSMCLTPSAPSTAALDHNARAPIGSTTAPTARNWYGPSLDQELLQSNGGNQVGPPGYRRRMAKSSSCLLVIGP